MAAFGAEAGACCICGRLVTITSDLSMPYWYCSRVYEDLSVDETENLARETVHTYIRRFVIYFVYIFPRLPNSVPDHSWYNSIQKQESTTLSCSDRHFLMDYIHIHLTANIELFLEFWCRKRGAYGTPPTRPW